MKKLIALLTALVLVTVMLASLAVAADGDDAQTEGGVYLLDGRVTGIETGYITMVLDGAEYQINMDETTILEGAETLAVGDWIQVIHNGQMTRSLPPQVFAQVICSYSISGVVSGLTEDSFIITDEAGTEIVVHFDPERFVGVQDTMTVTVWFDGMMTRSLPTQITAEHIRTMEMTGVIEEVTENGFLMTDADGIRTLVHLSGATAVFTEIAAGAAVRVTTDGTATMSLPAQVTAIEILPVPAAQDAEEGAEAEG